MLIQETTLTRSNPQIDPSLHVWHWEIPLYLFLGGVVAGVMIIAAVRILREGSGGWSRSMSLLPWSAPLLISIGMFFLWLDLEHPFNAFRFYLTVEPSSPMSWGAWILVGIYPASILLAWITAPRTLRAKWTQWLPYSDTVDRITEWVVERERHIAIVNVILGAALGVYTGLLLGTMGARPLWNSPVLGPLFLVSGVSTATAFMLLYRLSDDEKTVLGRLDMWLICAELMLIGLWLIGMVSGATPAQSAANQILGGPYTAAFWTMVVAVGLVVPLATEWFELRHGLVPGRAAALLVLIGGIALRWIIVYAGQHANLIERVALQ